MSAQPPEPSGRGEFLERLDALRSWYETNRSRVQVVLLVVLVVLAGVAVVRFARMRSWQARETAWAELAAARSPRELENVARAQDLPAVQSLARLRAADQILREVVLPETEAQPDEGGGTSPGDGATTQPATTAETPPAQRLERARGLYRAALEAEQAPKVVMLNARLGLAALAEQRGAWKDARTQYERVRDNAGAHAQLAKRAGARLRRLSELQQAVPFREPPETQPTGAGAAPPAPAPEPAG